MSDDLREDGPQWMIRMVICAATIAVGLGSVIVVYGMTKSMMSIIL